MDDSDFRHVMNEIQNLREHIDRLYKLIENIERKAEGEEAMGTERGIR